MPHHIHKDVRLLALDGRVRDRIMRDNPSKYWELLSDTCRRCRSRSIGLGGYLQRDGRIAVRMYCGDCYRVQTTDLKVPEEIRAAVGIIWRNDGEPCSVQGCGEVYSQEHHVLPKSVDADMAYRYPTVWLCVYHHSLWHEMTGIGLAEWR